MIKTFPWKTLWVWLAGSLLSPAASPDWFQFRGPTGQGFAASENLPLHWSESENVKWKTFLHGRAWSSPVIQGDRIWLTTATPEGDRLFVLCVDLRRGHILLDKELFQVTDPQFAHKFNTYASPTPVVEEGRAYVTFGSPGTACVDTRTGKVLWTREDFACNHYRGAGSSPIIHGELLIMNFDGSDRQYVVGLNKHTGETVWQIPRSIDFQDLTPEGEPMMEGDLRKAFSTPHVATFHGTDVLLSMGAKALYAYDPLTGREFWRVESRVSHSASTRPTVADGMIYYCTGFAKGEIWAVDPGFEQDPPVAAVRWKFKRSVPNKPSLLLIDGLVHMVDDGGIASCVEAATGKPVYQERVGGNYSASPVASPGRIYYFSEEGKTSVIRPGREFEILATNELEDGFMASPAVAGDDFILRTKTHLYRIGK